MKRIATAVVLIPLVLLLILRAPIVLLAAAVAAVAILTLRELLDLSRKYGVEPMHWPTYVLAALLFALAGFQGRAFGTVILLSLGMGLVCVTGVFVLSTLAMRRTELRTAFPAIAASVFGLAYIAVPLVMLVEVRDWWVAAVPGAVWIIYMLVIVWSGDTFALYVGKSIGRHKMSPRISPGKTWEGAIGSFVGSVALGTLIYANAYTITMWLAKAGLLQEYQIYRNPVEPKDIVSVLVLSAAINIAAQLGDLVESLIKRGAGVKDSGALLPGHGGMLDRIDAMLFAAPVLWCYLALRYLA